VVVGVLLTSIIASVIWAKEEEVRATKVRIEGTTQPLFLLSGTGTLAHLVIYDTRVSNADQEQSCALWEIEPVEGYSKGRRLEQIGDLRYGQVPSGYRQVCPENDDAPPALVKGNKYEYWFDTSGAPHARRYFVIRGTKAVEVDD
jgi:hypothetical protein